MIPIDSKQTEEVQKDKAVDLPEVGFVRLDPILRIFPVSKSAWWQGIREGRYPKGVKLGPRTTGWRVGDIKALIEGLE